jgi:hypothetical protein
MWDVHAVSRVSNPSVVVPTIGFPSDVAVIAEGAAVSVDPDCVAMFPLVTE